MSPCFVLVRYINAYWSGEEFRSETNVTVQENQAWIAFEDLLRTVYKYRVLFEEAVNIDGEWSGLRRQKREKGETWWQCKGFLFCSSLSKPRHDKLLSLAGKIGGATLKRLNLRSVWAMALFKHRCGTQRVVFDQRKSGCWQRTSVPAGTAGPRDIVWDRRVVEETAGSII